MHAPPPPTSPWAACAPYHGTAPPQTSARECSPDGTAIGFKGVSMLGRYSSSRIKRSERGLGKRLEKHLVSIFHVLCTQPSLHTTLCTQPNPIRVACSGVHVANRMTRILMLRRDLYSMRRHSSSMRGHSQEQPKKHSEKAASLRHLSSKRAWRSTQRSGPRSR